MMAATTDTLAYLDAYGQIASAAISAIALILTAWALLALKKQISEQIWSQKSQAGPLLELKFQAKEEEHSSIFIGDPMQIGPVFLPYRRRDYSQQVFGEHDASVPGREIACTVRNLQQHPLGFARNISIEIVGIWFLSGNRSRTRSHFIHLRTHRFDLGPNESRVIPVAQTAKFTAFEFQVRKLFYEDLWGHKYFANAGQIGGGQYISSERKSLFRPFNMVQPDRATEMPWKPFREPIRWFLLKEWISRILRK